MTSSVKAECRACTVQWKHRRIESVMSKLSRVNVIEISFMMCSKSKRSVEEVVELVGVKGPKQPGAKKYDAVQL
jgi:hypothetical protein